MKILQWTLALVGIIALAILGVGLALPSQFMVSRSIEVGAPAAKVYDLVADPRTWAKWSVWNRRDPAMELTYAGPAFGQGAKWSWRSKTEGSGSMDFVRVVPNRRIEYALAFPEFGMKSSGAFTFEDTPPGGTRVTWTNGGDVGANPMKHYLALFMDRIVGPDFEGGLANLKAVAEKP
jgi:uncharacterized protein YndB with AHSA1/START domain